MANGRRAAGRARGGDRRAPARRSRRRPGKRFGDPHDPLLVSVRSGAAVSMPGMMDTILNLGLNDEAVEGLARRDRQPALRLRLVPSADPDVRRGRGRDRRAPLRAGAERPQGSSAASQQDVDLDADDLASSSRPSRRSTRRRPASAFPQDAREQLRRAVRAVFESWDTPRAQVYRARARHPRRPRHRRQRRADGVRQQGRELGHRRRASRATRRPASAASTASSSPTRRARTSSPASARRSRSKRWRERCPRRSTQLLRDDAAPRGALPRHAGHRVHGRGRQALPAADALGEADGRRRAEGRRRHGRRGPDLARGGRRAHRPGASSTSCCIR